VLPNRQPRLWRAAQLSDLGERPAEGLGDVQRRWRVNRFMKREALDNIVKLWSINEPFTYAGRYWTLNN
jgi:hypothetical protein